jgi:anti-sigma factor RsiW
MTCDETREALVAFLDAELAPELHQRVREHLAGCAACAHEARELSATLELVARCDPAVATAAEPPLANEVRDLRRQVGDLARTVGVLRAEVDRARDVPPAGRADLGRLRLLG